MCLLRLTKIWKATLKYINTYFDSFNSNMSTKVFDKFGIEADVGVDTVVQTYISLLRGSWLWIYLNL